MIEFQNLIAGVFTPAQNNLCFPYSSPVTGIQVGQIADSDFMDCVRALQAANQAHQSLRKLTRDQQFSQLDLFLNVVSSRIDDFAHALALEQGSNLRFAKRACQRALVYAKSHVNQESIRPFAQSRSAPQEHPAAHEFESQMPDQIRDQRQDQSHSRRRSILAPLGVVAIITARLDAFESVLARLVPALAAGNVVIWKGSSLAPQTTQLFAEVVRDLCAQNLWTGAWVQILQGKGERIGNALVIHPGIHTLSITGQTATAIEIQKASSETFKRFHYSLGSRNPVLIFQETKIDEVLAKVIDLCVLETGARRGSRIFIQESVYKSYLEALGPALKKIRLGSPTESGIDLGPVASLELRNQLMAIIKVAKSEQAKSLMILPLSVSSEGYEAGYFLQPEALFDLTYCSTIQQEELLGPIVTITSFKYLHDAVKHAGNSPYGRFGYVFCDDLEKALKAAENLDVETVMVNPDLESGENLDDQTIPSSGLRQSGAGGSGFKEMIRFFSRETAVFGG